MSKFSGPKVEVTKYFMTLHMGAVLGPVNKFKKLVVKDKLVWEGEVTTNQVIPIVNTELFGGVTKEGGVHGDMHFLNGGPGQELSAFLAEKLGRTFDDCPGFRGFTSLFFTEPAQAAHKGFHWIANTGQMPNIKVTFEDLPDSWQPSLAGIAQPFSSGDTGVLSEVARGEYDLSSQPGSERTCYDFAGRRYFRFGVGTGPLGVDELFVFSMADHSQIGTVTLLWDASVASARDWAAYHAGDGLIYVNVEKVGGGFGFAVIDPDTGVLVSNNFAEQRNADWYIIDVAGIPHVVMYQFSGINAWRWAIWRFESGTFTDLGDVGISNSGAYFIGHEELATETRFYWLNVEDGAVRETKILTNGTFATRAVWTPPFGFGDAYYDSNDGGIVFRSGVQLHKYEVLNETFAQIWDNPNGVRQALHRFTHKTFSNVVNRIVLTGEIAGLANDWIDLRTGERVDEVNKSAVSITNAQFYTDDIGGASWYSSHGVNNFRWQGDPLEANGACLDANPAHIIREVLTDDEYGLGVPAAKIDDAAFLAAAITLVSEDLGISLLWSQQLTGEEFIDEILAHIEGVIYFDPHTGLIVLKLIRDDYDVATLDTITNDNAELTSFRRKSLGETVNQLTVTYTNGDNEEEATVSLQDLGNIAQQGQIVADSVTYAGVRTAKLAMQLARRDLRVSSYPIATAEVELDHSFWDIVPGQVVKFSWTWRDEDGALLHSITDMVMRVGEVTKGHKGSDGISVKLSEDIFALPVAEFATPPDTLDPNTDENPRNLDYVNIFTLPYYWTVNLIDAASLNAVTEPEVFAGIAAAQEGGDTANYTVLGETTDALGNVSFTAFGNNSIVARALLTAPLVEEIETTLPVFNNATQGLLPVVGSFLLFGDGAEADSELGIVTAITAGVSYTVKRGMLDTTPKVWPAATPVWVISDTADAFGEVNQTDIVDDQAYPAPITVDYKLLAITSRGTLDEASATVSSGPLSERPYRPLRPANVTVEGTAFGVVDLNGLVNASVAWSNRNRLTEDSQVLFWDDADVTGEAGQTTTIQALDVTKTTVLGEVTALAGTNFAFPLSNFGVAEEGYIRVIANRDGYDSFQDHDIRVDLTIASRALEGSLELRELEGATDTRKLED